MKATLFFACLILSFSCLGADDVKMILPQDPAYQRELKLAHYYAKSICPDAYTPCTDLYRQFTRDIHRLYVEQPDVFKDPDWPVDIVEQSSLILHGITVVKRETEAAQSSPSPSPTVDKTTLQDNSATDQALKEQQAEDAKVAAALQAEEDAGAKLEEKYKEEEQRLDEQERASIAKEAALDVPSTPQYVPPQAVVRRHGESVTQEELRSQGYSDAQTGYDYNPDAKPTPSAGDDSAYLQMQIRELQGEQQSQQMESWFNQHQ